MSSKANKANHAPASAQDSWSRVRLGDICEIVRGVTYKKDQAGEQPAKGMLPILRATNIQDNALVLASDLVYVPTDVVSEEQMLRVGDIVVATSSGSKHLVGKTAQVKESWAGSFGAFCAVLRPKTEINHRYLGYFFGSREYKDYIREKALGVNINNLRRGDLEEISVPVAPLDQQKHIVAEIEKQFSRLDEAVANLKRVKANLKRYKAAVLKAAVEGRLVETEAELARKQTPSPLAGEGGGEGASYETGAQLLQRILETRRSQWKGKGKYKEPAAPDTADLPKLPEGWVWALIGQAFDVYVGATPSRGKPEYWDGGIPWVSSGEVAFCRIKKTRETISSTGLANSSVRVHPVGTVLLGMIGEGKTRGQAAILDIEACNNQNAAAIRVSETEILPEYVYSFLEKEYEDTRRRGSGGNQPALNKDRVREIPFPLPPIAEQRLIVAEIDRRLSVIREVEAQIDVNLKRSDRLRQSILGKAFSGQIGLSARPTASVEIWAVSESA